MKKLWEFLVTYHDALTFLLTAIAAICAGIWAVYTWRKSKGAAVKDSTAAAVSTTHVNVGISLVEFEAAMQRQESRIRAELSSVAPIEAAKRDELEARLSETVAKLANVQTEYDSYKIRFTDALATLDELRKNLIPPQVDSDMFPTGLKVLSFVKGEHLRLQMTGIPLAARLFLCAFGTLWSGGCAVVLHQGGLPWPFAAPFFALVFYLAFFRAPSIKFNFVKRKITIAGGGGVAVSPSFPIFIDTKKEKKGWVGSLRVGARTFARFPPKASEEEAMNALIVFAKALNWQMGLPLLMGNGLTLAQSGK